MVKPLGREFSGEELLAGVTSGCLVHHAVPVVQPEELLKGVLREDSQNAIEE